MLSFMVINAKQRKVCSIISNGRWSLLLMLKEILRNPLLTDCFSFLGDVNLCSAWFTSKWDGFGLVLAAAVCLCLVRLCFVCHFVLRTSHHICFVGQADVFFTLVPWWFLAFWGVLSFWLWVCFRVCSIL